MEFGYFLACVLGAFVVACGIWRAWTRPKKDEPGDEQPTATAQPIEQPARRGFTIRGELARLFLSNGGDTVMSRSGAGDVTIHPSGVRSKPLVSAEKRNGETGESTIATAKADGSEAISFPDMFVGMAVAVQSKKLTETEALKIFCQVSPGSSPRYKVARERLQAALAALGGVEYLELDEHQRTTGNRVVVTK